MNDKCLNENLALIVVVAVFKALIMTAVALTLNGCGAEEGSNAPAEANIVAPDADEASSDKPLQSIAIASKKALPECTDENESQLAYTKDGREFYVCESGIWEIIPIEDGQDGVDGVTTVQEIEATNKKNIWVDPVIGLTWLLGGGGDHAQAVAACSGEYRLPTWAEAVAGINHGVRGIAASVPVGQNFWLDMGGQYWYATETSGMPNKFQVLATAGYSIYCVK